MPQPRQSKIKRLFGLKTFLIVNLALLFLITLSFGREFVRNYEIDKEIKDLEEKAAALETHNQEIIELAERLNTDDYLEQEGRMRLGLMKPGEQVAVISEPELAGEIAEPEATGESKKANKQKSNIELWWEYFFDLQYGR